MGKVSLPITIAHTHITIIVRYLTMLSMGKAAYRFAQQPFYHRWASVQAVTVEGKMENTPGERKKCSSLEQPLPMRNLVPIARQLKKHYTPIRLYSPTARPFAQLCLRDKLCLRANACARSRRALADGRRFKRVQKTQETSVLGDSVACYFFSSLSRPHLFPTCIFLLCRNCFLSLLSFNFSKFLICKSISVDVLS